MSTQLEDKENLADKMEETPTALQEVLQKFWHVFHMPAGLPPLQSHEHHITLKNGSNPVNVRPYRYPQVQKEEIERLVANMLQAGIIQPSRSPFSSPVLLVKKKRWVVEVLYRLSGLE